MVILKPGKLSHASIWKPAQLETDCGIDVTCIKDDVDKWKCCLFFHQRWIQLLCFLEKSKQTVQHVSFGSIEDMLQGQLVKMRGKTSSFLVKKLYGEIQYSQI